MDTGPVSADELCRRCGERVAPGTPHFSDRVAQGDGGFLCAECARAVLRGRRGEPSDEPHVPITQPNPNLPQTH